MSALLYMNIGHIYMNTGRIYIDIGRYMYVGISMNILSKAGDFFKNKAAKLLHIGYRYF
jgi:hypothetical protein